MSAFNFSYINQIVGYLLKLLKHSKTKFLYSSFLLFYAYKNSNTPSWAKNIILGSVAYVLSPIDSIPDLTPFLGMTDDIGVLSFGITSIACYIDQDVRIKAREKLAELLGDKVKESSLMEVEKWL